jgi:hypothetical protein
MGPRLEPIIDDLLDEFGSNIEQIADQMAPCEHCRNQKYETYILLTVLRRGFVDAYADS